MRRLGEQKWRNFILPSKVTHGFSSKTNPNPNEFLINAISKSLLHNETWETLSTKYSTVNLSNSVIQQILLRFKQPETAKSALNFFHWSAHNRNLRHGISTYAVTIHILVKSRLLIDARALIESSISNSDSDLFNSLLDTYEISSSTPLVFDLLVQCYAKLRNFEIGFEVFQKLSNRGFVLSVITLNTLLHYAVKSNRIDLVWRIYEVAIEKRTYPNETTIQIMISALCKEGKLKEVVDLLDKIQGKRSSSAPLIVNTSLVFRVLGENRIEEGMSLLKRLLQKNMVLDIIGYSIVVYAKIKQGDLEYARKVFDEMLQRGFDANAFVYTGFIKACCEKGEIEEAGRLLNEMESSGLNPYDETFNYLIEGCARFGKEEGSLKYCEIMVARGLRPSCLVFNEMVERLSKIENVKHANEILTKSIDNGFMPNEDTYSHLIRGFVEGNDIEQALKLFYEMEYREISPGFTVFRSLIVGLCACGKVEAGEKYLRIMKKRLIEPNADIYDALVNAFQKAGDKTNADRVYDEMMLIR
ncbi:Pentatricopeptide repeat-containing protein [Cardamine amara subsp. amara]|uniref:Pentatricopeptide repeat-containing protein n=1 Tax=Cardamine amara subsp. amara TaxID=228776 RepID=A0ABD1C126_CARAN